MTTKRSGGRITGLLALTCQGVSGLQVGDFVHLTGPYTVDLADGTKPILGQVSVRNVRRTSTVTATEFPVANPGGDVTVEVPGFYVTRTACDAAVTAGGAVGIDATGGKAPAGAGVRTIGVALTSTTNAGELFDLLVTNV